MMMAVQIPAEVLVVALGGSGFLGVAITKWAELRGKSMDGNRSEIQSLIEMLRKQGEETGANLGMLINHILSDVTKSAEAIKDLRTAVEECKSAHERCEEENQKMRCEIDALKSEVRTRN